MSGWDETHAVSDTMSEVRKAASASSPRVVFSTLDTFLANPQGTWINIPSESEKPGGQRGSVPGTLHTWFHFVTKPRAPSGRCPLTPSVHKEAGGSERFSDLPKASKLFPGRTNLNTTAWLWCLKSLGQSSLSRSDFLRHTSKG